MRTYQDLLKVINNEKELIEFIITAISDHKNSDDYKWAKIGKEYDRQENTTINRYQKMLFTVSGGTIPDYFSANHKLPSNYYNRFNVQENQFLLGNGVIFKDSTLKDKLGTKKKGFDTQLQKLGKLALTQKVAFGFWNLNHIDIFELLEFVPLLDEENGSLRAGIRFWQLADNKPLRATLYVEDGYTEYIRESLDKAMHVYVKKRPYILKVKSSKADGEEIYDGENYKGFPIVPLWGNQDHICKIKAWQRKIDAYDLISSGFCNDVDEASLIYWTIQNAGGMDDIDLAQFIQRLKTIHAASLLGGEDGQKIEAHTVDVPVEARKTYLELLEKDLYKDAMALDTEAIAKGNTVATAIRAAYVPLDQKTDDYEYCIIEFIQNILELAGFDDDPTFKRSYLINQSEETNMILAAAQVLDTETILKHLPFLSIDELPSIMDKLTREEANRFTQEEDELNGGQSERNNGQETETDGEGSF